MRDTHETLDAFLIAGENADMGVVHADSGIAYDAKYNANQTNKALNGAVACELSARKHGPGEWWMVVEKEGVLGVSGGAGK